VKSTMTAISVTFAIVFMVSFPYHAPNLKKKPRTGGAGLLGFHWGEPGDEEGTHHCPTHSTECRSRWGNFSSQT
jgi:hypothetical protein